MEHEIVDEILRVHTLESVLAELEVSEFEVLQALLDHGLLSFEDLHDLLTYDEEEI